MAAVEEWSRAFVLLEKLVCANVWHYDTIRKRGTSDSDLMFLKLWKRKIKKLFPNAYMSGGFVVYLMDHTTTFGRDYDIFVPDECAGAKLDAKLINLQKYMIRYMGFRSRIFYEPDHQYKTLLGHKTFDSIRVVIPRFRSLNIIVPTPQTVVKCPNAVALNKAMMECLRGFDLDLCKVAISNVGRVRTTLTKVTRVKRTVIDVQMCRVSMAKAPPPDDKQEAWSNSQARIRKYNKRFNAKKMKYQPCKLAIQCYNICKDMHDNLVT